MAQWRVDPGVKRTKKPKYKYKTVDELAEEGSGSAAGIATSSIKVVDMSGPQVQRCAQNYPRWICATVLHKRSSNVRQ